MNDACSQKKDEHRCAEVRCRNCGACTLHHDKAKCDSIWEQPGQSPERRHCQGCDKLKECAQVVVDLPPNTKRALWLCAECREGEKPDPAFVCCNDCLGTGERYPFSERDDNGDCPYCEGMGMIETKPEEDEDGD
jgi:hypothetical protein